MRHWFRFNYRFSWKWVSLWHGHAVNHSECPVRWHNKETVDWSNGLRSALIKTYSESITTLCVVWNWLKQDWHTIHNTHIWTSTLFQGKQETFKPICVILIRISLWLAGVCVMNEDLAGVVSTRMVAWVPGRVQVWLFCWDNDLVVFI